MISADRPETRLATRLAFLAAGFGIASWAPLVPFAKHRLGVDDGQLGLLLLCLGMGSVISMPLTGILSARFGSKPIIIAGGLGLALVLPLLSLANAPWILGLALLAFGASLGSLDVAMNVHAVDVERAANRPLMSGFHALFSVGGFAGATLMTLLLSFHLGAFASSLLCSALLLLAIAAAWPRLLRATNAEEGPLFVMPHGIVLVLAGLAAITFLAEGAILDWSALLITDKALVTKAQGGLGYTLFASAMTVGRLGGDAITARIGDRAALIWGGIIAISGFVILLLTPVPFIAMAGFLFIGLGASNVVPVLFRQAGSQRAMPAALAVAAITTTGYAGILLGPAGVGFVAKGVGLPIAFAMLAVLLCAVPACARLVTPRSA
ncbi:MFS transporter [Dyella telluris]|uniref:MFS transporter n=1 Tax=Dyella telluris TaxID=2763498 RepID=A0A7G8Q3S8_9GAMM|nr:MFS transporter [Dyella telluris]QNK01436.1 MFS transporter [Dyella telluris]